MKDLLDIYVRSLIEQEHERGAPECYQDLGTFACWLLERQGYELHVRSYRRHGTGYGTSTGRIQWGVDILASKPDADGVDRAFRFVLKQGDIDTFAPGTDGNMFNDLWLAAGRNPSDDSRHAPNHGGWERNTVVAVHNGDLNTDKIGAQVKQQREQMRKRCDVEVEWWDAQKLVTLALAPPVDNGGKALEEEGDASLFPPLVRPFARMALDSLQRDQDKVGFTFDLEAVDLLIEHIMPLGRVRMGHGPGSVLAEGEPLKARHLYRSASELALFAGMLEVECRRMAAGNSTPVLDTIARILCRLMEHLRRQGGAALSGFKGKLKKLCDTLIERYIAQATILCERLGPLLDEPYSLALAVRGEEVDYPLRTLRIAGYLATAGMACLDRKNPDQARTFGDALARLSKSNEGGLLNPIADDHIIELGAVWMLWLRLGMRDVVAGSTHQLLQRFGIRLRTGIPLPALYLSARQPMELSTLRMLVEAYALGADAVAGFNDSGSTIVPLAVVLCVRAGAPHPDELQAFWAAFRPTRSNEKQVRVVYPQSWQPPDDAANEWYVSEIRYRGFVQGYDSAADVEEMSRAFEEFHGTALPDSPARDWGFPMIDWLAFCVWRTPPPMSLFLQPELGSGPA